MSTLGPMAADLHVLLDAQLEAFAADAEASAANRRGLLDDLWSSPDLPFPGLARKAPGVAAVFAARRGNGRAGGADTADDDSFDDDFTAGPAATGPTAAGPTAAGPTAAGPTAAGPTAAGLVDAAILTMVPVTDAEQPVPGLGEGSVDEWLASLGDPVEVADLDLVFSRGRRFPWVRLPHLRSMQASLSQGRLQPRVVIVAVAALVLAVALVAGLLVFHGHSASMSPTGASVGGTVSSGSTSVSGPRSPSGVTGQHGGVNPVGSSGGSSTRSDAPRSSLPTSALEGQGTSGAPSDSAPASTGSTAASGPPAPVPAAGGGGTPGSTPSVSVDTAKLVLAGVWPQRLADLEAGDTNALANVDSGGALQGDIAAVTTGVTPPSVSVASAQVFVLSPAAYPLSFAAFMAGSDSEGPIEELAVLAQPSAAAPWTVALVVDVPASGASASSGGGTPVSGATLNALAQAWQQWAASGTAPTGGAVSFTDGDAFQQIGQAVADQVGVSSLSGLNERVTFEANAASAVQLPIQPGIACGAVDETAVYTSASGGVLTQPTDRSTWGASVAPGQYQSVTRQSVYEVCLASAPGSVAVFGGNGGLYGTTATPVG